MLPAAAVAFVGFLVGTEATKEWNPAKPNFQSHHRHHHHNGRLQQHAIRRQNAEGRVQNAVEEGSCHMTEAYPPDSTRTVEWYDVNLDDPPEVRWQKPVMALKDEIIAMFDLLYDCQDEGNEPCLFDRLIQLTTKEITGHESEIIARWPQDYGQELVGISNMTGVPLNQLIGLNMGYELMGACTSIVAYNSKSDTMYHGRNLDFGLMLGMNYSDFQWLMTSRLRDVTFNARMIKDGDVLWTGTFFGGFIGLVTGNRMNCETITINTRFDDNLDKYLIHWLRNPDDEDQFLTLTARLAIETYDKYDDAVNFIMNTDMVSPGYFIVGGPEPKQGGVITIGPNGTLEDYWDIESAYPSDASTSDKWYVLQTNYDHWNEAPFFDDRRDPGCDCMNQVGSDNLDLGTLYNVLYGKPNRNRLTAYTSLMECKTGHLEAYRQYCEDPNCSPW